MEMTLLLAEKQEKELFTVSFKTEKKEKKADTNTVFTLGVLQRLPRTPDLTTAC